MKNNNNKKKTTPEYDAYPVPLCITHRLIICPNKYAKSLSLIAIKPYPHLSIQQAPIHPNLTIFSLTPTY